MGIISLGEKQILLKIIQRGGRRGCLFLSQLGGNRVTETRKSRCSSPDGIQKPSPTGQESASAEGLNRGFKEVRCIGRRKNEGKEEGEKKINHNILTGEGKRWEAGMLGLLWAFIKCRQAR